MSNSSSESKWLYGIHGQGGEHLMLRSGKAGWIVASINVNDILASGCGIDFRAHRLLSMGVICTLHDGPELHAAIPTGERAQEFALRCADVVRSSAGCSIWVIGSEPNSTKPINPASSTTRLSESRQWYQRAPMAERIFRKSAYLPGVSPLDYVDCYARCRSAIRSVPGHERDQVLLAAIAAGKSDTRYEGNEWGDWIRYFQDVVSQLSADTCDGFALHVATQGPEPDRITSAAKVETPAGERHVELRSYRDFLYVVPDSMQHLAAYITQAHQGAEWADDNSGWVQALYDEIDEWNRLPDVPRIHAVALRGWDDDQASLRTKNRVWADLRSAMTQDHSWAARSPQPWRPGTELITTATVDLYESAHDGSPQLTEPFDILQPYSRLIVESAKTIRSEGRYWWRVREQGDRAKSRTGWIAQNLASGDKQVCQVPENYHALRTSFRPSSFWPGDNVRTITDVVLRRTPGAQDKTESDILADVPPDAQLAVLSGPRPLEGLNWWLVRWQAGYFKRPTGWIADTTPNGSILLRPERFPDGANATDGESNTPTGGDDDEEVGEHKYAHGDRVTTLLMTKLRKSPGYLDKPDKDIVAVVKAGALVTILDGPERANELLWWRVTIPQSKATRSRDGKLNHRTEPTDDDTDDELEGWLAEVSPAGDAILGEVVLQPQPKYNIGELVVTKQPNVRIRATPGLNHLPDSDDDMDGIEVRDDDVIGILHKNTTLVIQSASIHKDHIDWWRAGGIGKHGEAVGWVAQRTREGVELLEEPHPLPGTTIPDAQIGAYLHAPYPEITGISQLWGENAWYYKRYSYDGVPLLGHNGIDYSLRTGTPILATDSGSVITTAYEKDGFGWYVLLSHSWGQSIYAHMTSVDVKAGQHVRRGQILGPSGNTGGSTGPHLHFAIRIIPYKRGDGWGGYSDPLPYMNPESYILPNYILDEEFQMHRAGGRPLFPRLDPSAMGAISDGYERP